MLVPMMYASCISVRFCSWWWRTSRTRDECHDFRFQIRVRSICLAFAFEFVFPAPWTNQKAPRLLMKRGVLSKTRSIWIALGFDSPFQPNPMALHYFFMWCLHVTCLAFIHSFFIFFHLKIDNSKNTHPKFMILFLRCSSCGVLFYGYF